MELIPAALGAVASLADFDVSIKPVSSAIEKVGSNIAVLFVSDFAIPQLIVWAIALFSCAYLSDKIEGKHKQAISALPLLLIPITNFFVAPAFGNLANQLCFVYCGLSIGAIAGMEFFGLTLSR